MTALGDWGDDGNSPMGWPEYITRVWSSEQGFKMLIILKNQSIIL